MRWFIADPAEFERLFNELARRDFAWAYMEPKFVYTGPTRFFLPKRSNVLAQKTKH